jgi:predicted phosphate transport protein (TIGR00153 family)
MPTEGEPMRFTLIPREMKFFDMFDEIVALLTRASSKFLEMVTQFDRLKERSAELRAEEHDCDQVIARIITALDQSFITPFDREDIHALATRLDDIMDNLEETAHRFVTFRLDRPTPPMVDLARLTHECCKHLEQAVRSCRTMKDIDGIQGNLREIGRLENEADRIYRDSDGALFADPPEVLTLIKLRELYGWLEETVDACKVASLVISEIVIKGS